MSKNNSTKKFVLAVFIPLLFSSLSLTAFLTILEKPSVTFLIFSPFLNGVLISIIYGASEDKSYQKIFGAGVVNLFLFYFACLIITTVLSGNSTLNDGTKFILFMLFYPFFNIILLFCGVMLMFMGNFFGFMIAACLRR